MPTEAKANTDSVLPRRIDKLGAELYPWWSPVNGLFSLLGRDTFVRETL